uniref:Alpha/beta fold hydrolase n=1 Tax=Roseihalotalea indica TaxID=2867963 RepID=A0AA49GK65_9BACT|nr:alpha/beta fold hydrolase [Tunicatimonas sp. TK19036]
MKPATQYAKSGRINIAYQVFGSGPVDLVYIPGWISNIDWMWACPELVDFFMKLGHIARVILFDKRGTGLSDSVVELSTLEERMDDIRAVMDAVNSEKAILFGHSEGGSVSALFAATYPDRVIFLIAFGIFAKRRYAPTYPWAPTDQERQRVYDMIEHEWESGEMDLTSLAPSKAHDKTFMGWLANYFRSGASSQAAMVLTKMNTEVDIIDILGSIRVPTLLMQRTHDIDVKVEEGRFIAERIQGAKLVELKGNDHLFWVGDTKEVLEEMKEFILNTKPRHKYEKKLFTMMAARIISSEITHSAPQELISQFVRQYQGSIVQYDRQTFTATFEGPSKAVYCGLNLQSAMQSLKIDMALGIHIKERVITSPICNDIDEVAQAILQHTKPHQILVTQSVRYLLSGARLNFTQHKATLESTSGEALALFRVTEQVRCNRIPANLRPIKLPQSNSFLENVLQSIDTHLNNKSFGVSLLSKEVGISERQLQRKLKAVTSKSPNQLISSVRLHRAKELILEHDYTIAQIAFQTGFSSTSYFSKCFKKEFGLSPSVLLDQSLQTSMSEK